MEKQILEIVKQNDKYHGIGGLTVEEQFIYFVFDDIKNITKSFFDIGFRLDEANRRGYYKRLFNGKYKTIHELAEDIFKFKKSTTYNLIAIANTYRSNESPMLIAERWKNYSQSQLTEMINLPIIYKNQIAITDTVAEIKQFKKIIKDEFKYKREFSSAKDYISFYNQNNESITVTDNETKEEQPHTSTVFQTNGNIFSGKTFKSPYHFENEINETIHRLELFRCNYYRDVDSEDIKIIEQASLVQFLNVSR